MANIKDKINNIRKSIFGKDVRGSLADGLEVVNKEVENTTGRQDYLDKKYNEQIKNMTLESPSDAEIVDMRVDKHSGKTYEKAGDRLDEFSSQMAENEKYVNKKFYNNFINIVEYEHLVIDKNKPTEDWSIAIQTAIDEQLLTGSEILFPVGTYRYTKTLIVKNKTKLIGRDLQSTILNYVGSDIGITQEHSETIGGDINRYVNDLKLYDFVLKGEGIEGSSGLWLVHGGQHKYSNLRVENFDTNVILGSKTALYSLLFCEFQFDSYYAKNTSLLIRHIEDCIFPRNLIAGGGTSGGVKSEKAIQIGDVTLNGEQAKPFDIQFNMCVFQGAKVGVYHDGGYSVNFFGGHCEGLDQMVVQSQKTDRGLNFTGMTISKTVLSKGTLGASGINLETNGLSPKIYSQRILSEYNGASIPCRTTPYDAYSISTKIDFSKWQIGAFRIVARLESTVNSEKVLRILTFFGEELCILKTSDTGLITVTGDWRAFSMENTMPDTDLEFYLQTIGANQPSGTIKLISVDIQGTQFI